MTSTHLCHARQCNKPVPPRMLMCKRHWFMVPQPLRNAIWASYEPGQERRKDTADEYLAAARAAIARAAIEAVWAAENPSGGQAELA